MIISTCTIKTKCSFYNVYFVLRMTSI